MELSKPNTIKEFDNYLKELLSNMHVDEKEKKELEEEWRQHLYDHYHSLKKQGVEERESIRTVIGQFGDIEMLQDEVNKTYPSFIKNHIQKEIIIAFICIIASLIGAAVLIGAHFRSYLIFAPIQALIIAYPLHRFIIMRQYYWLFSAIGFLAIYIFFLQLIPQFYGSRLTLELYVNQLFSLEWDRLTGMNGLFEFPTIHMMWYVIILVQILSPKNFNPIWKKICNASFQYWGILLLAILLARGQSSAEWGVLYLNVFLLYSFLQHTISIQRILIWKEKFSRILIRQPL
jgi:hypothetical protein